jgi:hypothetical protein
MGVAVVDAHIRVKDSVSTKVLLHDGKWDVKYKGPGGSGLSAPEVLRLMEYRDGSAEAHMSLLCKKLHEASASDTNSRWQEFIAESLEVDDLDVDDEGDDAVVEEPDLAMRRLTGDAFVSPLPTVGRVCDDVM